MIYHIKYKGLWRLIPPAGGGGGGMFGRTAESWLRNQPLNFITRPGTVGNDQLVVEA